MSGLAFYRNRLQLKKELGKDRIIFLGGACMQCCLTRLQHNQPSEAGDMSTLDKVRK